jgi:putative oxidoreductase
MAATVSRSSTGSAPAEDGSLARAVAGLGPYAPTILRVIAGVVFLVYGTNKLADPAGFAGFVGSLGFPVPDVFAWLVIGLEIIGGAALVVGVLVRPVALLFLIEMTVTALRVKLERGIAPAEGSGMEIDLVLWAAAAALLILGAGRLSVDRDVIGRDLI